MSDVEIFVIMYSKFINNGFNLINNGFTNNVHHARYFQIFTIPNYTMCNCNNLFNNKYSRCDVIPITLCDFSQTEYLSFFVNE